MERVTVRYRGRVQGVGFRATAAMIAQRFDVVGVVRNVHDGSVELIAEGEPGVLRDFLDAIGQRMGRNIVDQQENWAKITDRSYATFCIGPSI